MGNFEFRIEGITPVGLDGDSQRPTHTNVVGRILKGSIAVGDLVQVPMKTGGSRKAAVKWLMVEFSAPERAPRTLTAEDHGKYVCGISLRIPPDEAALIDPNGVLKNNA